MKIQSVRGLTLARLYGMKFERFEKSEAEFKSLRDIIDAAVEKKWPKKYWVRDFSVDSIQLRSSGPGLSASDYSDDTLWQTDYVVKNNEVTFIGDLKKVKRVVSYVPYE